MEKEIDLVGQLCPMPVIKVQNLAKQSQIGDIIVARCTDPGVKADIPAWCRINGHEILAIEESDDLITVRVKVG